MGLTPVKMTKCGQKRSKKFSSLFEFEPSVWRQVLSFNFSLLTYKMDVLAKEEKGLDVCLASRHKLTTKINFTFQFFLPFC
jgi:hypothetical protein